MPCRHAVSCTLQAYSSNDQPDTAFYIFERGKEIANEVGSEAQAEGTNEMGIGMGPAETNRWWSAQAASEHQAPHNPEIDHLAELLETEISLHGATHPNVVEALTNLGVAYSDDNQQDRAIEMYVFPCCI